MAIKEIFEKYLKESKTLKQSSDELGDRSSYIGASDIGSCERKAVLSKLQPQDNPLEKLMVFIRGHLGETIVAEVMEAAGYKYSTQETLVHPDYPFIKAHLDFMFRAGNKVRALEIKTVSNIPSEPYQTWVDQVTYQLGLLRLNYPEADIKGLVLAINLNTGELQEYEIEENPAYFNILVEKAQTLFNKIEQKTTENLETEVALLCAFCPFKDSCPEFTGDEQNVSEDLKRDVEQYKELSKQEKSIKKEKDAIKDELINIIGSGVLKFDGNKVTVKETTRTSVDSKKLKKEFSEVYQQVIKESTLTYFRLD